MKIIKKCVAWRYNLPLFYFTGWRVKYPWFRFFVYKVYFICPETLKGLN